MVGNRRSGRNTGDAQDALFQRQPKSIPSKISLTTSIPQHIFLRELGGCANIRQKKGHKAMTEANQRDQNFYSHPHINRNSIRHSSRILKHLISSNNRQFLLATGGGPIIGGGGSRGALMEVQLCGI